MPNNVAPIALNAALPGSSPNATESPKSNKPPMIGSRFVNGRTNLRTVFAPPLPRTPVRAFLPNLAIGPLSVPGLPGLKGLPGFDGFGGFLCLGGFLL